MGQTSFHQICFIISQIMFIPSFFIITKRAFLHEMKKSDYVKVFFLSPFMVYIYASVLVAFIAAKSGLTGVGGIIANSGEFIALIISFLLAWLYSKLDRHGANRVMVFTHLYCYLMGMAFNLVFSSYLFSILFSIVMPFIANIFLIKVISKRIVEIADSPELFQPTMLVLPLIAEFLMTCRIVVGLLQTSDHYFLKYDSLITILGTFFGYSVVLYIMVSIGLVSRNVTSIKNNIRKNEELSEINKSLTEINLRMDQYTVDMLNALVSTIEAKDEYTNGHSMRVAKYSRMIAERAGMAVEDIKEIYMSALLHDIGKIAVPDYIINKPGKLSAEEFEIVKQHPKRGFDILKDIDEMPKLYHGALYHHERWDGKGYPNRIAGEEIPVVARIIAVADAYDAMTSKRSYRNPLSQEMVRSEIESGLGTQFAPEYAKIMLEIIDSEH